MGVGITSNGSELGEELQAPAPESWDARMVSYLPHDGPNTAAEPGLLCRPGLVSPYGNGCSASYQLSSIKKLSQIRRPVLLFILSSRKRRLLSAAQFHPASCCPALGLGPSELVAIDLEACG